MSMGVENFQLLFLLLSIEHNILFVSLLHDKCELKQKGRNQGEEKIKKRRTFFLMLKGEMEKHAEQVEVQF